MTQDALYEKYRVERTDGKTVGPCFVLELDDRKTHRALLTWAETLDQEGLTTLAAQIRKRVLGRMKVYENLDKFFGDDTQDDGCQHTEHGYRRLRRTNSPNT